MNFAQNLKAAMESKSITMYRLAKELGVHQTTIKNWIDGKGEPRISEVQAIAATLGCDPYSLYSWDQATAALEDGATIEISSSFHASATLHAHVRARKRINAAVDQMTTEGQSKVADYAEDILPRYCATRRQEPEKAPSAPPEGTDTTPS